MARQPKKGLAYFPTDVDLYDDFKIIDLLERFGPQGTTIYQVLLTLIYKNGYYLDTPLDKVSLLLVRTIGSKWINKERAKQVIRYCAEIGLFDSDLLSQGVITSVGIQLRYREVTARNKSDKSLYWLLNDKQPLENVAETPQNVAETPQNVAETPISVTEMQQIKENKIKEKKEENNNSSEQGELAHEPVIITLPLIDKTEFCVVQSKIDEWSDSFPAVDVNAELKRMRAWLNANPTKKKTLRGIQRFIVTWLSKTQDMGGTRGYKPQKPYDKSSPTSYSGSDDSMEFIKEYGV